MSAMVISAGRRKRPRTSGAKVHIAGVAFCRPGGIAARGAGGRQPDSQVGTSSFGCRWWRDLLSFSAGDWWSAGQAQRRLTDISHWGERSIDGTLSLHEVMRNRLLFAGLLAIGSMMAYFLRSDLHRSGAGTPLPPSGPREDGQGLDLPREPSPELIPVHRAPPIDLDTQLSHATLEEVRDRPRSPRDRRLELLRDSGGALPPGDWDWDMIRPQLLDWDRPDDSLLMRDMGLGRDRNSRLRR